MPSAILSGVTDGIRPRLFLIAPGIAGPYTDGAGARLRLLAETLVDEVDVVLATTEPPEPPIDGVRVVSADDAACVPEATVADLTLAVPATYAERPATVAACRRMGIDFARGGTPRAMAEQLREASTGRISLLGMRIGLLKQAAVCVAASEQQALVAQGLLLGAQRADAADPDLIVRLPTPLPPGRPSTMPGARAWFDFIGPLDPICLVPRAEIETADLDTPIRAIAILRREIPNMRLVFMTTATHDGALPAHVARAMDLARELKLLDVGVFFNTKPGWVEWSERGRWLNEAAVGLVIEDASGGGAHASAALADLIWAARPVVATIGSAGQAAAARVGLDVTPGDPEALASCLQRFFNVETVRAAAEGAVQAERARRQAASPTLALLDWLYRPATAPESSTHEPIVAPENRLDELQWALQQVVDHLEGLEHRAKSDRFAESLAGDLESRLDAFEQVEQTAHDSERTLADTSQQLDETLHALHEISESAQELREAVAQAEQGRDAAQSELALLRTAAGTLEAELEHARGQLTDRESSLQTVQDKIAEEWNRREAVLVDTGDALMRRVREVEAELQAARDRGASLETMHAVMEQERDGLAAETEALRETSRSAGDDADARVAAAADEAQALAAQIVELQQARSAAAAQTAELAEMQEKLVLAEKRLAEARSGEVRATGARADTEAELSLLRTQFADTQQVAANQARRLNILRKIPGARLLWRLISRGR